jgi:hypothetical protein
MLIGKSIQLEKSLKYLFLYLSGLIFLSMNLSFIDFGQTYAVTLVVGLILLTSYRLYIVSSSGRSGFRDYDDEL